MSQPQLVKGLRGYEVQEKQNGLLELQSIGQSANHASENTH